MTDIAMPKPSLGVGSIVSETFGLFFRKFVPVFLAAFAPFLIVTLISVALLGVDVALGEPDEFGDFDFLGFGLVWILNAIATGIATAAIVQIAYGEKTGREISLGAAFSASMAFVVPIIVISVVVSLVTTIAMMALVLPGLYVWAMWSVAVPAIVVEGSGYGALGRSAALTKEYRWPVLGAIVIVSICLVVISIVMATLSAVALEFGGVVPAILLQSALGAIPYGLLCVEIALIYARLREIKEGVSVSSIVEVFA